MFGVDCVDSVDSVDSVDISRLQRRHLRLPQPAAVAPRALARHRLVTPEVVAGAHVPAARHTCHVSHFTRGTCNMSRGARVATIYLLIMCSRV